MTVVLESQTARVKWLAAPSSQAWLEQAVARPDLVLIDHAHCERKAAGVALQLMFRYPSDEQLGEQLSALAREELEHFEQVLALLAAQSPDPELQALYGELLASEARHFGLYWVLCEQRFGREVTVERLQELAAFESKALSGSLERPDLVRMHSVGIGV